MKKILTVFIIILLSPLIFVFLIWALIYSLFDRLKEPKRKKEYYSSAYYKDFSEPYSRSVIYQDSYLFYNETKDSKAEFTFVHQETNGTNYIVYGGTVYLFQLDSDVFEGIFYHDQDKEWKANIDGEWVSLDEAWKDYITHIENTNESTNIVMLLKDICLLPRYDGTEEEETDDRAIELLPDYIKVVSKYTDILQ